MLHPDEWADLAGKLALGDAAARARVADESAYLIPLMRRSLVGDAEAGNALVAWHYPWIEAEAASFGWTSSPELDIHLYYALILEGMIGLRDFLAIFPPASLEHRGAPNPDAFPEYVDYMREAIRRLMIERCGARLLPAYLRIRARGVGRPPIYEGRIAKYAVQFARPLPGCSFEDLINVGVGGFCEAIDKYRPDKGATFGSYLQFWLKRRMIEATVEAMSLSDDARKAWSRVRDGRDILLDQLGREPTPDEIVAFWHSHRPPRRGKGRATAEPRKGKEGVSITYVKEILAAIDRVVVSLDGADENEDGSESIPIAEKVPGSDPGPEAVTIRKDEKLGYSDQLDKIARAHPKFAAVTILRVNETVRAKGLALEEIVQYVRTPDDAKMQQAWPPKLYGPWPSGLPRDWPGICALFSTPPPDLSADQEMAANALSQWYGRERALVRQKFPSPFREE